MSQDATKPEAIKGGRQEAVAIERGRDVGYLDGEEAGSLLSEGATHLETSRDRKD